MNISTKRCRETTALLFQHLGVDKLEEDAELNYQNEKTHKRVDQPMSKTSSVEIEPSPMPKLRR